MMNRPEIQQTLAPTASTKIPTASPYFDRLRSLHIQQMNVPVGTDEYKFLDRQISELELRARKRMTMDLSIGIR